MFEVVVCCNSKACLTFGWICTDSDDPKPMLFRGRSLTIYGFAYATNIDLHLTPKETHAFGGIEIIEKPIRS